MNLYLLLNWFNIYNVEFDEVCFNFRLFFFINWIIMISKKWITSNWVVQIINNLLWISNILCPLLNSRRMNTYLCLSQGLFALKGKIQFSAFKIKDLALELLERSNFLFNISYPAVYMRASHEKIKMKCWIFICNQIVSKKVYSLQSVEFIKI